MRLSINIITIVMLWCSVMFLAGCSGGSGGGSADGQNEGESNAVTNEEYLASLPAACERYQLDGRYTLDTEYAFQFQKAPVPVSAVFDKGDLREFDGMVCSVRQTWANKSPVRDTDCPTCNILWDCGGCWLLQEVRTQISNNHQWTLTTVRGSQCEKYGDGVSYMVSKPTASSCFYTDSNYCRNDDGCNTGEVCSLGQCKVQVGINPGTPPSCSSCISACSGIPGITSCCTGVGCICEGCQ